MLCVLPSPGRVAWLLGILGSHASLAVWVVCNSLHYTNQEVCSLKCVRTTWPWGLHCAGLQRWTRWAWYTHSSSRCLCESTIVAALGREEGGRQAKGCVRVAAAVSWAGDHQSDTGCGAQEGSPLSLALVSPEIVTPGRKGRDTCTTTAGSQSLATAFLHLQRRRHGSLVRLDILNKKQKAIYKHIQTCL